MTSDLEIDQLQAQAAALEAGFTVLTGNPGLMAWHRATGKPEPAA